MKHPLDRRVAAAEASKAKFEGKRWKPGRYDCAQLSGWHLRAAGCPLKAVARPGPYNSIEGGVKQLRKLGFSSLFDVLDAHFERIAPAAALVADIIAIPSEDDRIGGLTIYLGNGRVLGYHPDAPGATVLQPLQYVTAWRVPVT